MGSSEPFSDEGSKVEHTSLTELFEKNCPIYMSYGMTYNEFWYDSAYKVKFYRESYKLKLKQQDENNWMQGMYVYEALCKVSPILHAFSKKGTKPLPYAEKPFLMDKIAPREKTQKEIEQEKENERLKAMIYFNNVFRAMERKFKNE